MAIFFPDILENNNSNFPVASATSLKGTAYPLASINNTGSIPTDKRNVGTIVFDSGSGKFYGFKGSSVSNWNTGSNWIEFGSGSGGGTTVNHLFDRCIVNGFTYDGYNPGLLNLQFVPTGSTLNALFGENLGYKVGDKMIVYVDDKNYIKGTVNQVPGGFGVGSINVLVNAVIGTTASDDYCITLDLTRDSYVYATQTGSFLYSGSYNSTTSALTLHSSTNTYNLDLSGLAGGGGGGFAITASNEGTVLTENARTFDFVGNAVTATNIGSAVTVTINTGSASTTDITALNNFTGSANTRLGNLEAATGSYVTNARTGSFYYSSSISSNVITFNQGDGTTESITITSVPSASSAPNLYNSDGVITVPRIVTLNGESLTFETQAGGGLAVNLFETGSFDVNYIDNQSAFRITSSPTQTVPKLLGLDSNDRVVNMATSSIPNLYNSNGTLPATGTRRVIFGDSSILRFDLSSSIAGSPRVAFDTNTATSGVRFAGTGYVQLDTSTVTVANIANTVQPDILGRDSLGNVTYFSTSSIPNLYNSNGTLTGDRTITLGNDNELRITPGTGVSEFRVSNGPSGGPFNYEVVVNGGGEFRVSSPASASFVTNVYISPAHILTLGPRHPLPTVGIPTGSFAVSSSTPPRPFMWDGNTWYAL